MTAALMRFALDRSFGGSTNLTGRVSDRHACLPKTHDGVAVVDPGLYFSAFLVDVPRSYLDVRKRVLGIWKVLSYLICGINKYLPTLLGYNPILAPRGREGTVIEAFVKYSDGDLSRTRPQGATTTSMHSVAV
jgi:hypothetical protein